MRVKCINDREYCGFSDRKISGLTKWTIYEATPVTTGEKITIDSVSISKNDEIKFLIFDDNAEWELYDKDDFVPADFMTIEESRERSRRT